MADWTFERDSQLAPKSRQRVRVAAAVVTPGAAVFPFNYEHRFGSYYETYVRANNVWFRRSHWATPPWEFDRVVTSTGDTSYSRIYTDHRTQVYLLYQRTGPNVYQRRSNDEGFSWEAEVLMLSGCSKPFGSVNPFDGTEIVAGFHGATSKIRAVRRQVGDTAYSAEFAVKDDAGADMLFEDDTFSFHWAYESPNRLVLVCHIDGETDISTHWSADSGATFKRIA